jgi:hypothetical protein
MREINMTNKIELNIVLRSRKIKNATLYRR